MCLCCLKLWHQRACYLCTSGSKHIAVETWAPVWLVRKPDSGHVRLVKGTEVSLFLHPSRSPLTPQKVSRTLPYPLPLNSRPVPLLTTAKQGPT